MDGLKLFYACQIALVQLQRGGSANNVTMLPTARNELLGVPAAPNREHCLPPVSSGTWAMCRMRSLIHINPPGLCHMELALTESIVHLWPGIQLQSPVTEISLSVWSADSSLASQGLLPWPHPAIVHIYHMRQP